MCRSTQLHGSATRVRDTRVSALAYYRTIDEPDDEAAKRVLSGWLAQAGFAGGATDWAAMRAALTSSTTGAHAVYLNNFDLGFGRDMYLRLGACDDGTPASLAQATQGACDVYGVVINYGSLEAAARNLQPIIAVAMEYTRAPASGDQRITKFYTYAPNRRGDFDRVLSIDLDGRGEKFMPGACTVCHGGTPRGLDAGDPARYGNGGDVDATFLPWDLDSLLYSDTDPAFSHAGDPDFPPTEQELAAAFRTRTAGRKLQAAEPARVAHLRRRGSLSRSRATWSKAGTAAPGSPTRRLTGAMCRRAGARRPKVIPRTRLRSISTCSRATAGPAT